MGALPFLFDNMFLICYYQYVSTIEKQYYQNVLNHLHEGVTMLSKALGLSAEIKVEFSHGHDFPSPTTQAITITSKDDTYTVKLNMDISLGAPHEFILAHELRHIYQIEYIRTHDDTITKKWESEAGKGHSTDNIEYNLRDSELDANAFAVYVYARITGRDVLTVADFILYSLPDDIIDEIAMRAKRCRAHI